MKRKIQVILFSVVMMLSITGCGGQGSSNDTSVSTETEKVGDKTESSQEATASDENEKVIASVTVENAQDWGACGGDATWYFQNNILVIKGNGSVPEAMWEKSEEFDANEDISWVLIDEGIQELGEGLFYGYEGLTKVVMSSTIEIIGDSVFAQCKNLGVANLPEALKSIGNSAFEGCDNLKAIEFPESLEMIGDDAFKDCVQIKEIFIPTNVKEVGSFAFADCEALEKATIGAKKIGYASFYSCEIKELSLLDGVESIGYVSFYSCSNLSKVYIPDSVTEIGESAFGNCGQIEIEYNGSATGYPWNQEVEDSIY